MSIEDSYNFRRIDDRLTTSGMMSVAQLGDQRGHGRRHRLARIVRDDEDGEGGHGAADHNLSRESR